MDGGEEVGGEFVVASCAATEVLQSSDTCARSGSVALTGCGVPLGRRGSQGEPPDDRQSAVSWLPLPAGHNSLGGGRVLAEMAAQLAAEQVAFCREWHGFD